MDGKWIVHDVREAYANEWVAVSIADVELPDGQHIEHSVVSQPKHRGGSMVLAHDEQQRVLMIWRHRFIPDVWTWELPCGGIDEGESPVEAGKREFLEETGWEAGKLEKLTTFGPMNGLVEYTGHAFTTSSAKWNASTSDEQPSSEKSPGIDKNEVADIAWLTLDEIRRLMQKGDVFDGFSSLTLLWAMQFGPLR